jgi:isoquinoline 1-oxidoreductase beta subunit
MNIPHAFAIGSFMDELAVAAGKDPANFLFTHLAGPRRVDLKSQEVEYPNYGAALEDYPIDAGRLQDVLQFAVERSGWSDPLLPHQGRGVAIHRSYLSYVAGVAVVTVGADGKVSVPRFDIAIDCGRAINPDRIRALMEDQVMYGIGIALFNAVAISNGVVGNANFDTYLQARAEHTPEIHVHLVVSSQPPGGVGDSGVPVVAPAIANAIFAACGKRVRALPIDPALLKDAPPASPPQPPNPKD